MDGAGVGAGSDRWAISEHSVDSRSQQVTQSERVISDGQVSARDPTVRPSISAAERQKSLAAILKPNQVVGSVASVVRETEWGVE